MSNPQIIGVGLLGLGVVGSGVAEALESQKESLASRIGAPIRLCRVLVRELDKRREISLPRHLLTQDAAEILSDPEIQIVVELIGGEMPARNYIKESLTGDKHVVTANKEVMAKHGSDLLALADSRKLHLRFEGSVGGAIPIIGLLTRDLLANEIRSIHAIINGTTNFILTQMADQGMDAEKALKLAQSLGYAEADPSNDVEGTDAAYKLAILATLAFHSGVRPEDVYQEGISKLHPKDFKYARELGWAIKLLATTKRDKNSIEARVHPALIPETNLLAKVGGAYNAVEVEGSLLGRTVFHGLGAGKNPTASAVVGDLVEVGRGITSNREPLSSNWGNSKLKIRSMADLETRYYFRLSVSDQAGVLSQITRTLGDLNISIASIIQKDADMSSNTAEIVITTHPARESDVQTSIALLRQLDVIKDVSSLIRMEELPP